MTDVAQIDQAAGKSIPESDSADETRVMRFRPQRFVLVTAMLTSAAFI